MAKASTQIGFHYGDGYGDDPLGNGWTWSHKTIHQDTEFTYTFENFFHPYVGELISRLNQKSLKGLLDPSYQQSLTKDFFAAYYAAVQSSLVKVNSSPKKIDLDDGGAYSNYNWELLFHVPLAIAIHLSKNQRFAEAQRWFHYIFDPTSNDPLQPPQRFWKFLRFRQETDVHQIDALLALLSKPAAECTEAELELKAKILSGYEAISRRSLQPHAVARTRTVAYQYCVVMKYLDNLIAWGDTLFLQDTVESINEATQLYVLAANLLGPRPQEIPRRGSVRAKTFQQLKADLDAMGNALVELEGQFPFNLALPQTGDAGAGSPTGPLFGIGRTLYFCIPRNEKLLAYWDTVADRLFKIRHCMNIEGVVRQLALFDTPLLAKAAAAGIDVGSLVGGLNQPIGPARSLLLIEKALELCGEVRGLGNALLSAIEKADAEHLGLLRQGHEIKVQQMSREVRFLQWRQTQEATESLLRTRASALERYRYYQRLLGLSPDPDAAPETLPLDRRELTEDNFADAYDALVGQYDRAIAVQPYPALLIAEESSPSTQSGASGQGQLYLNSNENADLNQHGPRAREDRLLAMQIDTISGVLALLPEFGIDYKFWGVGGHSEIFGGKMLADVGRFYSSVKNIQAFVEEARGASAVKTAAYQRRADEWILQNNLAARELMQLGRQILSALLSEQIAHHDYLTVQKQIAQAQEIDRFLRDKFTDEDLYLWMQGELSRLYYEYYRFAFDTARKAERTMKRELMRPEVDNTEYVQFNYWDGGRKGLLAGEALYLDVKRMEMAYHDNNKREFEITRHISLRQLNPLALLNLKTTGACDVTIPEWLYDRDCPGHYLRRLKNVAISVPSVVGPYTSINCTLSLLRSTVRTSPQLKDNGYKRDDRNGDDRFVDYFGSVQSVVTSSATNDSGLFETNLRDDHVLPFEGAGAVGAWHLELPRDFRVFDYMTIADVILHVRYTARAGGDALAKQAIAEMRDMLAQANESGLALLFSLRHDFPTEWSAFVSGSGELLLRLRKSYFPYMVQNEKLVIDTLELYAAGGNTLTRRSMAIPADLADNLNGANGYSDLSVEPDSAVLTHAPSPVFLIVRYRYSMAD